MARLTDPAFRIRSGVIFAQVVFMFLALYGAGAVRFRAAPALVATGFLFFLLWQVLDIVPRAVDAWAVSRVWAPAWLAAEDPAARQGYLYAIRTWADVAAALGIARRVAWGAGHLLFAPAFLRGDRLETAIGAFFAFNAARLLPRSVGEIARWPGLATLTTGKWWFVAGTLPLFALLGVWLWREASGRDARTTFTRGAA
ncbi:MAG: hypothetical protein R3199_11800 [Gemmatimonadota bacterium]|nr:hypothetical protein [Gemmatimonadota bacterium]